MNDEDFTELTKRVETLEKRVSFLEAKKGVCADSPHAITKKLSLKEFLISKKPSDNVKKTLAIGFYLEKFEGLSSFNAGDLVSSFERAKEKKPLNINDKVNMNIRNGYMDEVEEKKGSRKAWHLTSTGEQLVENNFIASK